MREWASISATQRQMAAQPGKLNSCVAPVDRVVFDGCRHVETGLLEAETHPSRSCEQIDA